jgi:hypothetical protein
MKRTIKTTPRRLQSDAGIPAAAFPIAPDRALHVDADGGAFRMLAPSEYPYDADPESILMRRIEIPPAIAADVAVYAAAQLGYLDAEADWPKPEWTTRELGESRRMGITNSFGPEAGNKGK